MKLKDRLILEAPKKLLFSFFTNLIMVLSLPIAVVGSLYFNIYLESNTITVVFLTILAIFLFVLGSYLSFRNYTILEIDEKNIAKLYIPIRTGRSINSTLGFEFKLNDIEEVKIKIHPFTHCGRLIIKIRNPVCYSKGFKSKTKNSEKLITKSVVSDMKNLDIFKNRIETFK